MGERKVNWSRVNNFLETHECNAFDKARRINALITHNNDDDDVKYTQHPSMTAIYFISSLSRSLSKVKQLQLKNIKT